MRIIDQLYSTTYRDIYGAQSILIIVVGFIWSYPVFYCVILYSKSNHAAREREFISQMNKQIKQIQISTVAGYQWRQMSIYAGRPITWPKYLNLLTNIKEQSHNEKVGKELATILFLSAWLKTIQTVFRVLNAPLSVIFMKNTRTYLFQASCNVYFHKHSQRVQWM